MKTFYPVATAAWQLSLLLCFFVSWGNAQDCLPEGITFSDQDQIDAFASSYPGCTTILGNVTVEESITGTITNLRGLSALTAFGDYLEIHDNAKLPDLVGLENVTTIAGGLNIYGNPNLQHLGGLENLQSISSSFRIALNHELKSIKSLAALETVGGDLTVADNLKLPSLQGLESVDTVGGYLLIMTSNLLINLNGLESLRGTGKGVLLEDNTELRDLRGIDQLNSIGGNFIIVNNPKLRTLDGLQSLTSVGGKLQIGLNPFLEDLTALKKLTRIDGLLQVYANTGLKSLEGLENIDAEGIEDLAILSCDILRICNVESICDYLGESSNQAAISLNGTGCNFRAQILDRCQRKGTSGRPPQRKDAIFFPNPTSGLVTIKTEGLDGATIEVSSALGRMLINGKLENNQFDLSDLSAGMYFVKIKTGDLELKRKIVKLN